MKITALKYYSGAKQKVCRLGLSSLFLEVQDIILNTKINIKDEKNGNGSAFVRKAIDSEFEKAGDWVKSTSGDIDWIKRIRYNESIIARLGVEIQVSGRSELMIKDILHIRNSIQAGDIDAGLLVVPSDDFAYYLPDRVPCFSYALKFSEEIAKEAKDYPIIIMGIEHDGFSNEALPKLKTNVGK
ncbi:hypothetical protein [Methanothrix soehngenii]|jgi:hypothetical protein|uniref:hypothetical protein n=1 Tax=Methanothrix soehngenii TaxID=2223 RepID=UPI00300CF279